MQLGVQLFARLCSLDPSTEAANYQVTDASDSTEAWDIEGLWSEIHLAEEVKDERRKQERAEQPSAPTPLWQRQLQDAASVASAPRDLGSIDGPCANGATQEPACSSIVARTSSSSSITSDPSDLASVRTISTPVVPAISPFEIAISPSDLAMVRALFDEDATSPNTLARRRHRRHRRHHHAERRAAEERREVEEGRRRRRNAEADEGREVGDVGGDTRREAVVLGRRRLSADRAALRHAVRAEAHFAPARLAKEGRAKGSVAGLKYDKENQAVGNRAASSSEKGRGDAGGRRGLVARGGAGGNSEAGSSEGCGFASELRATARALCGPTTAPTTTAPQTAPMTAPPQTAPPPPLLPALPSMRPEAFVAIVDTNQWLHDFEKVAGLAHTAPLGRVVIGVPQAVLRELEQTKRHGDQLGFNARRALRFIDERQPTAGAAATGAGAGAGGGFLQLRVQGFQESGVDFAAEGFLAPTNADEHILCWAIHLARAQAQGGCGRPVSLLTADLALKIKANASGVACNTAGAMAALPTAMLPTATLPSAPTAGTMQGDPSLRHPTAVLQPPAAALQPPGAALQPPAAVLLLPPAAVMPQPAAAAAPPSAYAMQIAHHLAARATAEKAAAEKAAAGLRRWAAAKRRDLPCCCRPRCRRHHRC